MFFLRQIKKIGGEKEKMFPVYELEQLLELMGFEEIRKSLSEIRKLIKQAEKTGKRQTLSFNDNDDEEYQVDSSANIYKNGKFIVHFSDLNFS